MSIDTETAAKVAKHDLDTAEQRVVTLRELLGDDMPDLDTIQAALIEVAGTA